MQRAGQTWLADLLDGVALYMPLGLHRLCIREGPAITETRAAFGPQQAGNGDAVNLGCWGGKFHAENVVLIRKQVHKITNTKNNKPTHKNTRYHIARALSGFSKELSFRDEIWSRNKRRNH